MKNIRAIFSLVFILVAFTMSGCELVGDIFEAGMWTAVIIIAVVIMLILWLLRKIRGPRNRI